MHGPGMFFRFFGIIPVIGTGVFLLLVIWLVRRVLGSGRQPFFLSKEEQAPAGKVFSGKIPEQLKEAGLQVLENLDWDIRFLENQRLEAETPKERKAIEKELRRKREEYQITVARLEP